MSAKERRGLRALEYDIAHAAPTPAPLEPITREAFLTNIADAKAKHDARQRQAERARNPFHLTDKGVTLLLVWPSTAIGAFVLGAAVWAFMFTTWR